MGPDTHVTKKMTRFCEHLPHVFKVHSPHIQKVNMDAIKSFICGGTFRQSHLKRLTSGDLGDYGNSVILERSLHLGEDTCVNTGGLMLHHS